jgi:hypothetical protein
MAGVPQFRLTILNPEVNRRIGRAFDHNGVESGIFHFGRPETACLTVGHAAAAGRLASDGAAALAADGQAGGGADGEGQGVFRSQGVSVGGGVLPKVVKPDETAAQLLTVERLVRGFNFYLAISQINVEDFSGEAV